MVAGLCLLLAVAYWLGGRRRVRLMGADRRWRARHWRAMAFAAAVAALLVTLSEAVDAITRQNLWLRTLQLIVLAMVVAPLLVVGAPLPRFLSLLGRPVRRQAEAARERALAIFILFNGLLLLAFVPQVVQLTAVPGWPRSFSQLILLGVAFAFWGEVIAQPPRRCGLSHMGRIVYLLLSSTLVRILGLILSFAPASLYGGPLADQQLAAGILIVPGVLTDLIVLTACLYLWLDDDARRVPDRSPSGRSVSQRGLA
jgi:cytochrome c oxidase assembly factor CtaG